MAVFDTILAAVPGATHNSQLLLAASQHSAGEYDEWMSLCVLSQLKTN